ncbi:TetR/AcrR family transcriptional regulator [Kribbella sp. NPDC051770]|uniref:TetR/AcrR family transcriptional regulator n=1 Tax=Kribbella sp. NPDC051770 TaxID=3155413 RepID=UPI0034410AF2
MPRRSDARQKMIDAARGLIRERGLNATAISDVLERSGAPKGSVYFHFPGGKAQLAVEAAASHAHQQVRMIDEFAAESSSAAELIGWYVDAGRDGMLASDFSRGCGLAPLVTEGPHDLEEVAGTSRRGFTEMVDRVAFHFVAFGIDRAAARSLADAVVAGVEGAMITARAFRSTSPWDAVKAALLAYEKTIR